MLRKHAHLFSNRKLLDDAVMNTDGLSRPVRLDDSEPVESLRDVICDRHRTILQLA